MTTYDAVIVGGGPAGLAAALVLGRARKRVLLVDAGQPRNQRAHQVHGFLTRDGTPPAEFRRLALEQLLPYPSVEVRQSRVTEWRGSKGNFEVNLEEATVACKRLLLAIGIIDELPEIPGFRELWGTAVFQCPYCHAWEVQDRSLGFLAPSADRVEAALLLLGWSKNLTFFTDSRFSLPDEQRARLAARGVRLEEQPVARLVPASHDTEETRLQAVELEGGQQVACEYLFARPAQRQSDLVKTLALTDEDFVRVNDDMETSYPGIYAAGDLTTSSQGALTAAAAGTHAAYSLNYELTVGQDH